MSARDTSRTAESKKERRKKLRDAIAGFRTRLSQICSSIGRGVDLMERFNNLATEIREFLQESAVGELVPPRVQKRMAEAAQYLEEAASRTRTASDVCSKAQKALRYAERALGFRLAATLGVTGSLVVAATAIAGIVILANGATVLVHNQNCAALSIPGVANFLPGIDFPGEIPQGETGRIRVPKALVGRLGIWDGEIALDALGRRIPIPVFDLNLESSTWDGTPLIELQGSRLAIGGDREYLLTLGCR